MQKVHQNTFHILSEKLLSRHQSKNIYYFPADKSKFSNNMYIDFPSLLNILQISYHPTDGAPAHNFNYSLIYNFHLLEILVNIYQ
jgi:hypothetical protein